MCNPFPLPPAPGLGQAVLPARCAPADTWLVYRQADPVGGIELELIWPGLPLPDERNALSSEPPHRASATLWLLSAYAPTTGKSALPAELLCVAAVDLSPQKGVLPLRDPYLWKSI